MTKIIRNSIKCLVCGDEIESRTRHDFKYCRCGAVAVDGGRDYLRRLGRQFRDTSISEGGEDDHDDDAA